MLLLGYVEPLGNPGQLRSNAMRKHSSVVHAQCIWRFWCNRQHLWNRLSWIYGFVTGEVQRVHKPPCKCMKAWAAVMSLQLVLYWILFLYYEIFLFSVEDDHDSCLAAILHKLSPKEGRPEAQKCLENVWRCSWMFGFCKRVTGIGKMVYVS